MRTCLMLHVCSNQINMASSPPKPKRLRRSPSYGQPRLDGDLLVDEVLTRLPIAAAVRLRAVCREWNAALTSDHFVRAHSARAAAAARQPELLFFAPGAGKGISTSFYACSLRDGEAPTAARELLTIDYISANRTVMSPTPCRGLTLIFNTRAPEYYLLNLSTGDHVVLPPCQRAEVLDGLLLRLPCGRTSYFPARPPWSPFELSTTGLGFDTATGEHKVVRLFKKRNWDHTCEVYTPGRAPGGWRPCVGRVPACAANFVPALPPVFVDGYLYWLLPPAGRREEPTHRILSFSVGAEQFGWVHVPTGLSTMMCHLANLDGLLCAVVDNRLFGDVYALFTWSGRSSASASWSVRCSINLRSLPQQVSDELGEERVVVPLCSAAGGKVLLATGRHKVFAYDAESNTVERVFRMQEFVDVPDDALTARLLLGVGLHEERIADVRHGAGGERRLDVKLGRCDNVVAKREVPADIKYDDDGKMTVFFKHLAELGPPHLNM
uniref:F-box associated beta-propeller type 3 domain-containing protein n=1 Tax=Oryza brachyantha TaxID=4533 RepID=J3M3E2_ORYBR